MDVEEFDPAIRQMFLGGTRIGAVVAFSGQDEDEILGSREQEREAGEFFADAPDDLSLGLAARPGGFFPLAHLSDADDRDRHGRRVQDLVLGSSKQTEIWVAQPSWLRATKPIAFPRKMKCGKAKPYSLITDGSRSLGSSHR